MKRIIPLLLVVVLAIGFSRQLPSEPTAEISPVLSGIFQNSTPDTTIAVWIFFSDKGPDVSEKLVAAEQALTEHARKRRLRNRGAKNLVDERDLPVYGPYLSSLKPLVVRLRHKSRWLNAVSAEIRPANIEAVSRLGFVKKIEPVRSAKLPLPQVTPLTELPPRSTEDHIFDYGGSFDQNNQLNVPQLHDWEYDGSGVIIAMLDAGFNNLQHEALDFVQILKTWDFVNGDSVVSDEPGQMGVGNHGTYTLSVLAGFAEGKLIGPAFNAMYLLAKTENTEYERNIEEDHWVAGAEWADSLGADIISSSLGYRDFDAGQISYSWQDMDGNTAVTTVAADIAASRGILVVNSAGNEGFAVPPQNTLVAPADGDSVLAAGAVTSSGVRAFFSSMGPTADGRIKPDLMAMGSSVLCAGTASATDYVLVSGTSLSAPLLAGAAALILQVNPNWSNMNILEAMKNTASNAASPNNEMGWGIPDAVDAAFNYTGLKASSAVTPAEFQLLPAYPNPFNSTVVFRFRLPEATRIDLSIFNVTGQRIVTLVSGFRTPGNYTLKWDARGMPSGVYLLSLTSGAIRKTRKIVLIK